MSESTLRVENLCTHFHTRQGVFTSTRAIRGGSDACQRNPHFLKPATAPAHPRRHTDDREPRRRMCELEIRGARPLRGDRNPHLREHFVGGDGGRQHAREEPARGDHARPLRAERHHLRLEHEDRGRVVRRGVGVHEAAAHRSGVAHLDVSDAGGGLREQRESIPHQA